MNSKKRVRHLSHNRRYALPAGLMLGCLVAALAASPGHSRAGDTIDQRFETLFGAHEPYRAFFETLKDAVARDDAKAVAALVAYPLTVQIDGQVTSIGDAARFERMYADILTPALRKAITDQTYDTLFANWQGVSIGDGKLWFSGVGDGTQVRIIAING